MHGVGDSWAVAEKNLHLSRTFLKHPTFLLDTQAIYKPTRSTSLGQIHCFSHCYLFFFFICKSVQANHFRQQNISTVICSLGVLKRPGQSHHCWTTKMFRNKYRERRGVPATGHQGQWPSYTQPNSKPYSSYLYSNIFYSNVWRCSGLTSKHLDICQDNVVCNSQLNY